MSWPLRKAIPLTSCSQGLPRAESHDCEVPFRWEAMHRCHAGAKAFPTCTPLAHAADSTPSVVCDSISPPPLFTPLSV